MPSQVGLKSLFFFVNNAAITQIESKVAEACSRGSEKKLANRLSPLEDR